MLSLSLKRNRSYHPHSNPYYSIPNHFISIRTIAFHVSIRDTCIRSALITVTSRTRFLMVAFVAIKKKKSHTALTSKPHLIINFRFLRWKLTNKNLCFIFKNRAYHHSYAFIYVPSTPKPHIIHKAYILASHRYFC